MNFLTTEQIKEKAPAIFSDNYAKDKLSEKYVFVPTHKILNLFEQFNYYPVKVFQSKPHKNNIKNYSVDKHIIRLRHAQEKEMFNEVGSVLPEIVLVNSHNGTSAIKIMLGLFRLVCSNGLVVANSMIADFKYKHYGINPDDVYRVTVTVKDKFNEVWDKIQNYKSINLTNNMKLEFATVVRDYVWQNTNVIDPQSLIQPRREIDRQDDLFTTYNVIQENITKGNVAYINSRYNTIRMTRPIKNGHKDLNVNCFLWQLMNNFARTERFI